MIVRRTLDLYFTDGNGVRHVVANRADLEAGHTSVMMPVQRAWAMEII